MVKLALRLCLMLWLIAPLLAQPQVSVSLSSPTVALDESAVITVTVSGTTDDIDAAPPETRDGGLQFTYTGRRISMSNINGQTSSSVQIDYLINPMRTGRHLIEPITGTVGGVSFTTTSTRIEVTDVGTGQSASATGAGNNPYSSPGRGWPYSSSRRNTTSWDSDPIFPEPREDDFLLEAVVEPSVVYKHQPVFFNLRLLAASRPLSDPRYSPINPTGFLRVPFEQENGQEERNGRLYSVNSVKTAFFPLNEGDYTFDSIHVAIAAGLFSLPQNLKTEAKTIKVLPLPTEGRPKSFTGAVGHHFEVQAHLKEAMITQGGAAELEVSVKGDGHLDLVPYPYLPDWVGVEKKSLKSQTSTTVENGEIISQRSYKFRLKPGKAGEVKLSGIALAFFNPGEKRYEVVKAPDLTLRVAENRRAEAEGGAEGATVAEGDEPRLQPGATAARLPQRPLAALAVGGALLLLGAGLALPGRRLNWRPAGVRRSSVKGRYATLKELSAALQTLAPGPDSASRAQALASQGWGPNSVARYEELRKRAARAEYGGGAEQEPSVLDGLNKELVELTRERQK